MTVRRHGLLAGCAALALAAAACSATAPAGEAVVLQGTLVLRGNEPHVVPVLLRGPAEAWELQDVPPATARRLQNQEVQATGRVLRAPGTGFQLPVLRVARLAPAR